MHSQHIVEEERRVSPERTVVEELVRTITPLLPITVEEIHWNDPFVRLGSERWHLVVGCPWELSRSGDVVLTLESLNVAEGLAGLLGRRLNAISVAANRIDPIFHFDDSIDLALAADTDFDPWVMSVEGSPLIFVGVSHAP
jgi:hypothetical protein